jgi:Fur family ferric uptake transcriptional regulator
MEPTGPAATETQPRPEWTSVRDRLRERGLRWTPQRRTLIEVLARTDGHVTGSELVERCREVDPGTIPSTVYRTLDVLEELGLLSHSHAADGREEFHVLPDAEHGHLHCSICGGTWEIPISEAMALVASIERSRGFAVDVTHLSIAGRCGPCRERTAEPGQVGVEAGQVGVEGGERRAARATAAVTPRAGPRGR